MQYTPYAFDAPGAPLPPARVPQAGTAAPPGMAPYIQPLSVEANLAGAVDFSHLSPYILANPKTTLPPPPPISDGRDVQISESGNVTVQGAPIAVGASAQFLLAHPPFEAPGGQYGDLTTLSFVLAANQSLKVLGRPTFKRLMLQLQNRGLVNDFTYNLGGPATPASLGVPPGGSTAYMNSVPQNELYIFSAAGTTVAIGFIDATQPDAPTAYTDQGTVTQGALPTLPAA